jgi:hypothetical protein
MSLLDAAARARHDLGKYIAFQVRWLAPDASADDLRAALRADLLETHRGPDGVADAVTVWRRLRGELEPAGIEAIDARMDEIAALASRLDELDAAGLRRAADLALAVGDELKALYLRVRG